MAVAVAVGVAVPVAVAVAVGVGHVALLTGTESTAGLAVPVGAGPVVTGDVVGGVPLVIVRFT